MSKGKNKRVVPRDNEWAAHGAGNSRATRIFSTQKRRLRLSVIINQTQRYMAEIDKFWEATAMEMTLADQKSKNKGGVYGGNSSVFCR